MPSKKRIILLFAVIALIVGINWGVNLVHRSNQLSAETSMAAALNEKDKHHKLNSSLKSQAALLPKSKTNGSSHSTTVTTANGCTKTQTTKTTKTSSGTTNVTSTSVKCTNQGQNGSSSVSITSNSNQSASSGSNTTGNSGSSTNTDSTNNNIEITN